MRGLRVGFFVLAFVLTYSVAAVGLSTAGWRMTRSGSVPVGIYRPTGEPPTYGAIVLVCLSREQGAFGLRRRYLHEGFCPSGLRELLKPVAGMPGDTVQLTPAGIYVNGSLLKGSTPPEYDSDGLPLPPAYDTWVLGPHTYYLYSSHLPERSYDSRYFGPVTGEVITMEAVWLW